MKDFHEWLYEEEGHTELPSYYYSHQSHCSEAHRQTEIGERACEGKQDVCTASSSLLKNSI